MNLMATIKSRMMSVKSGLSLSRIKHVLNDARERVRLIEMIGFALFVPLVGAQVFSNDPLGLNAGFPWLAALPVVFAARYGSGWGISCGIIAALMCAYPWAAYEGQTSALVVLAVGTVILCVVVGDSATAWRRRSGQAEAENQYLRHRLKEFSNDYHVLKVSHGQLEEYMAGQRLSLRSALQQLQPVLSSSDDGLKAGSELMAVFAQFCSVQIAGLYPIENGAQLNVEPVATHGDMVALPKDDPLLSLAIEERKLVSVKVESLANDANESELLAVVPLVDAQGQLHGVLAIKDMHFMAFQQDNLNILALLGGYIGDMLTRSRGQSQSNTGLFSAELDTALRFARSHSVQSTLVCIRLIEHNQSEAVLDFITGSIRSLDSAWMPPEDYATPSAAVLLPLMTEMQSEAYLLRLRSAVQEKFETDLQLLTESVAIMQIDAHDSRQVCLDFIRGNTGPVNASVQDDNYNEMAQERAA